MSLRLTRKLTVCVTLNESTAPHSYHANQHIDERTGSDTKPVSLPANPALKAKQSDKAQGYPNENWRKQTWSVAVIAYAGDAVSQPVNQHYRAKYEEHSLRKVQLPRKYYGECH